jgi:predicted permease
VDAGSNWHTLAFLIVLCAAATVLTGLTPAFHCLRTRVNDHLKDSSRGSTSGPAGHRTRSLLVVSEVALATVAIVGTGALVRVFRDTRALDPGMDAANVACAKYYVATFCRTTEERRQFCLRLARRLRETPGVTAVGYANRIPLEYGDAIQTSIAVEGYAPAIGEDMRVRNHSVSPGYFNALGIPVLEGRDFTEQDKAGAPRALVVNQAFVRRFLGGGPVVGRRVRGEDGGPWFTVVGVVRDSRYYRLTEPREPYFYTASSQTSGGEFWMAFFVRTAGPIDPALPALGREAALVHAGTRGSSFLPYRLWLDSALYPQRVAATLVGVVGVISLLLSAIGLYSVLAFAVSRRINEFGIRIALGARRRHVLGDVLRQGAVLTVAGIGAGSVLALLALRLSASLLPELRTGDPVTLASSVLLLGLVGCLASYLPARRATRVDPLQALRHD